MAGNGKAPSRPRKETSFPNSDFPGLRAITRMEKIRVKERMASLPITFLIKEEKSPKYPHEGYSEKAVCQGGHGHRQKGDMEESFNGNKNKRTGGETGPSSGNRASQRYDRVALIPVVGRQLCVRCLMICFRQDPISPVLRHQL